LDLHRMRTVVENALKLRRLSLDNTNLKRQLEERRPVSEIIGSSEKLRVIKEIIKQVARTNATILLTGESGVGKEVIVNAIQADSDRASKPYIKVNAAALPRDLLESELFGHEKGSFTGAFRQKKGRFELADGGTLFLDEIGEMPVETQVKLLRVLQEQSFERVGGTETLKTDVRLICATNQDLEKAIEQGRFRRDLYYRINVIKIEVPPLRERREDILPLVKFFVRQFAGHGSATKVSADTMAVLSAYDWPGNVREL
jgi:transcriptional regulator with GAF, ATPase, and Fis domain